MNHGDETPWPLIEKADKVIISDFCLPPNDMKQIPNLEWYDHHISSITKMEGISINGLQDTGLAGCELTWKGLFPAQPIPWAVKFLGVYDTWKWKELSEPMQEAVLNFQYGMRLSAWWPDDEVWLSLLNGHPQLEEKIQYSGQAVRTYQKQMMERITPACSLISWEGYSWVVCNSWQTASTNYESYLESIADSVKVHGVIIFHRAHGKWSYSLRSFDPSLNVSVIAGRYGGGGHAGAAGFGTEELLEVLS
jgi:oligoribonuclease NrnB/cAMP/cGMP phosphodiesterase (DHH superfamily)